MPAGFKPVGSSSKKKDVEPDSDPQQPPDPPASKPLTVLLSPTAKVGIAATTSIVAWHLALYFLAVRLLPNTTLECPKVEPVAKDSPVFPVSCDEVGPTAAAVLSALNTAEPVWSPVGFSNLPYASISVKEAVSFLTRSTLGFDASSVGQASARLLAHTPTDSSGNIEQLMETIGGDSICLDARVDLISIPLGNSTVGCERRHATIGVFAVVGTQSSSRNLVQALRGDLAIPGFHLPCAANDEAALLTTLRFLASKDHDMPGEGWDCPRLRPPCARRIPGQLTVVRVWIDREAAQKSKLQ